MKNSTQIIAIILALLFLGCKSNKLMNEAINNDDPETGPVQRYELANSYYDKGDYFKAIQLYEIVIQENIMKNDLAEVYFRYANSHFAQYDYVSASQLFSNFYQSYPDNPNAETAYFYKALSNYELAEPDPRLDQSTITTAMKEFQDYLITYPEGEYADAAQKIIEEVISINERKELQKGKLYYKIEEYKAAIQEYNRFIEDHPTSELVEEAYYEILRSRIELAKHSYETKKKERYEKVIEECGYFMEKYQYGTYTKQATEIKKEAEKELKHL